MSVSTALLVVSCDAYRDLWEPFFTLLFRYWTDCPFRIYLGSNHAAYPDRRVAALTVGEDRDWSSNLLRMLELIPDGGVLLLQEDFLIDRPVQTEKVKHLIGYADEKQAACLRLMPIPGPDQACADNPEVGSIAIGAAYRVSLQAAWWRKENLAAIARAGESPWQFEHLGSRRSDVLSAPFLSLRDGIEYPLDYFTTAVFRGFWEPGAVALCRRENIPVDLKRRPVMPLRMRMERSLRRKGVPDRLARMLTLPLRLQAAASKKT
jgi:hypothetical protein